MNKKKYEWEHQPGNPETSVNEIIELLYKCKFVNRYLWQRLDPEFIDDVEQDVYLALLKQGKKLKQQWKKNGLNGVRQYTSGVIIRMISPSGYYGRKYKTWKETETNESSLMTTQDEWQGESKLDRIMEQNHIWQDPVLPKIS